MTKSAEWFRMTRAEQYAARERGIALCVDMAWWCMHQGMQETAEQFYLRVMRLEMQNDKLALVIAREEAQRCSRSSYGERGPSSP